MNTTFEEFAKVVCLDKRSETLDAGNVKLAYHGFVEKVFYYPFVFNHLIVTVNFLIGRGKRKRTIT